MFVLVVIPHLIWVCAGAGWWLIDDRFVRSFGSRRGICIVQGHPRMSTPARKRLMRDFKRLMQDPPAGISGAPQDNNILLWNAVIFGYDAELLLSPLSIWTAVWQWLCICWFHLQPRRYSMGWRLVNQFPLWIEYLCFILLRNLFSLTTANSLRLKCFSWNFQTIAHAYAAASSNANA